MEEFKRESKLTCCERVYQKELEVVRFGIYFRTLVILIRQSWEATRLAYLRDNGPEIPLHESRSPPSEPMSLSLALEI